MAVPFNEKKRTFLKLRPGGIDGSAIQKINILRLPLLKKKIWQTLGYFIIDPTGYFTKTVLTKGKKVQEKASPTYI